MEKKLIVAVVGLFLVLPTHDAVARGAKVAVVIVSGQHVTGELLSVRDSAVVISTLKAAGEHTLLTRTNGITVVKIQEIFQVAVKGKSNVGEGAAFGFLIGAGTGVLIGLASGDDPKEEFLSFTAGQKAAIGGVALGSVGFVVGTLVGIASSTRGKNIWPVANQDLSSLRRYARFPENEPKWLRAIQ